MIGSYWQVTWRSLLRRKLYTMLNVLGLTLALASSIIIFLYARSELSYDASHANAERIHLVYKERQTATGVQELTDTWMPLLQVLQERHPAIADGVRVYEEDRMWVELEGDRKFSEAVTFADPSLLRIFSFPLAQGDAASALDGRNTMVLSREVAERYFGSEDPLGKVVTLDFREDYVVTGVLADIPRNSTLRPGIIVPLESFAAPGLTAGEGWNASFLQTFLLLRDGADPAALEAEFPALVATLFDPASPNGVQNMKLKLWSLRSLHDLLVSSNTTSYVLLGIAFAIIVVAAINFMNLSIARSLERAREVGVRKTLGSPRMQLLLLFFLEPLSISTLSVLLSVELASILLPVFNGVYGVDLALSPLTDPFLLVMLVTVGLVSALLSGFYPALILSSFRSVEAMKGKMTSNPQGIRLRTGLTFLQFALAIVLVTGIGAVWLQIRFMQEQPLNFESANVVVIPVNAGDFAERELAAGRLETFRNGIRDIAGVASVSASTSVPGNYQEENVFLQPEGLTEPPSVRALRAWTDENYFATYGMSFVEGENFSDANTAAGMPAYIINETALRALGWDSALGRQMNGGVVVGVVEDFHYRSLEDGIRPLMHRYVPPQESAALNFISVKLDVADPQLVLTQIEALWRELDPSRTFGYYFAEDGIEALYSGINNTGRILGYFALLSIVIANLGLLGLSSYTVVQRTKEIGIRKVFGSTVAEIAALLSGQFVKPVLLANLLAWPIGWFAIQRWLEGFAYRADINWLMLPLGGIGILVLALVTVSLQSARAASINPVHALRYE